MKKILPIILILVLGGGAYMVYSSRTTTTSTNSTDATSQTGSSSAERETSKPDDFKGTLAAAVKLGVPLKCTYVLENGSGEGYIKGKNYRGSMHTKDGDSTEILMKDTCMWTWSSKTSGMKICYDPTEAQTKLWQDMAEKAQASPTTQDARNPEPVPNVEYDCKPTITTETVFEPPADVTFTDLSEMMKPGALPDMSKLQDMMKQP